MEIIFIVLTGLLMSAALCGAFYLGFTFGKKSETKAANDDKVVLDKDNAKAVKDLLEWLSYGGK